MKKERLFTLGYGPDKNGCTTYWAKDFNCIINEWRGDVAPEEIKSMGSLILNKIARYKPASLVEDFRFLTSHSNEVKEYFGKTFIPGALKLGITKNALIMPDDPESRNFSENILHDSAEVSEEGSGCLQFFSTTDLPKAVQWIKQI